MPADDDHEFRSGEPIAPAPPTAPRLAGPGWPDAALDGVLDHVTEMVLVADLAGTITRANWAARFTWPWLEVGMSVDELAARLPHLEPGGRAPLPAARLPFARALRGEALDGTELVVAAPGRARMILRIGGGPLLEGGRRVGAVVVAREVTPHRRAEARFEALFQASALGVALLGPGGRFVATNPALRRMLGYAERELASMSSQDLTDPADYAREQVERRRLLEGAVEGYEMEVRVRTKDGRQRWISKVVSRFPWALGGDEALVVCMAQDVTDRVEAEAKLRGTEARLRALLESTPAFVMVLDLDGRIQYLNRMASGAPPETCVGRDGFDGLLPAYLPAVARARAEVVRTRTAQRLEAQARNSVGEVRWYDITLGPITEDGAVVAFVVLSIDVTDRHRAMERLAAHEALLAEAERSASFGSWRLDLRSGVVSWSDGMFRLLGHEPGAVAPSIAAYLERLAPAQRVLLGYGEAEIRAGLVPPVEEHRILRTDGEERVLRFAGHVERDATGEPVQVIGVAKDVTDEARSEQAKVDFLSVVSHEMRSPLTLVRAPLQLLVRGQLDPRTPQGEMLLGLAMQGVERMTRLVADIHDFQRLETGRLTLDLGPVDGPGLVAEVVAAQRSAAEQAGVRLEAEATPVTLHGDAARLEQVLTNLVENAIKYSPPGGTVRVALAARACEAAFAVCDEGRGIPAAQREAIFERYVQLGEKNVRPARGLGLGLAIAKDIVALHAGRIWVEPRPGGGSCFRFTLPVGRTPPDR